MSAILLLCRGVFNLNKAKSVVRTVAYFPFDVFQSYGNIIQTFYLSYTLFIFFSNFIRKK